MKADPLRRFVMEILARAPKQAALIILFMVLSSLLEGFAITLLFPLLNLLGFSSGSQLDGLSNAIKSAFNILGVAFTSYTVAGLLVLMFALQHGANIGQVWLSAGLQTGLTAHWRRQLIDAVLKVEWLHFTQKKIGDLSHVINTETQRSALLVSTGAQSIALACTGIVYCCVAFVASWKMTALLLIGGAVIVGFSQLLVRRPTEASKRLSERTSRLMGYTNEVLSGMKLIRAMDGAKTAEDTLWPLIDDARSIERHIYFQTPVLRAGFEISAVIVLLATLLVARDLLGAEAATVLLLAAIFLRLYPRISTAQTFVHQFRVHIPYYAAVTGMLDEITANAEPVARTLGIAIGRKDPPRIEFEGVAISYGERPALNAVSFVIPERDTVAIVGPSGAGKSTLVDALLRLVPVTNGVIKVDGTPLSHINLAEWRRTVGYVPQDTFLFNATIRENIAFAAPRAREEEIQDAAEKAQLTRFIESLPDGWNTKVGDRGVMLSGGQRQRVGLARALLGGKSLLILDEATSALDSATEASIMQDIGRLHGQATIIIIAHRLSTIRAADSIVVLDNGRVAETGSWAALIGLRGTFYRLWQMQTELPEIRQER